jgi:hypothetical protein
MKTIKKFCFLFLFLGIFSGLQALERADEPLDFSKYQFIKASSNSFVITDTGVYLIDTFSNETLKIDGLINIESEFYAIQKVQIEDPDMEAICGHRYGCWTCFGCINPKCWNYCPGCKKK